MQGIPNCKAYPTALIRTLGMFRAYSLALTRTLNMVMVYNTALNRGFGHVYALPHSSIRALGMSMT